MDRALIGNVVLREQVAVLQGSSFIDEALLVGRHFRRRDALLLELEDRGRSRDDQLKVLARARLHDEGHVDARARGGHRCHRCTSARRRRVLFFVWRPESWFGFRETEGRCAARDRHDALAWLSRQVESALLVQRGPRWLRFGLQSSSMVLASVLQPLAKAGFLNAEHWLARVLLTI